METTNRATTVPTTRSSSCHGAGHDSRSWLRGRRGLIIGGAVAAGVVALALSQHWLALANLLPLLFVLPCALMMLKCMKGNHGKETEGEQTTATPQVPVASYVRNRPN